MNSFLFLLFFSLSLLPFFLPPSPFPLKCPTIHFRLSLINIRKRGTPEFHWMPSLSTDGCPVVTVMQKHPLRKWFRELVLGTQSNKAVHRPQRVGFRKKFYCIIRRWSLVEKNQRYWVTGGVPSMA